jgi:hypothetical protein
MNVLLWKDNSIQNRQWIVNRSRQKDFANTAQAQADRWDEGPFLQWDILPQVLRSA